MRVSGSRILHLGAKGGVDVRELEADVARADDGNPVRDRLELERVVRGEDSLSINSDARGHKRDGARCQDDVLGSDSLVSASALDGVGSNEDASLGNGLDTEST